ncbi:hypothetical protein D3C72_596760 [compost metagenome]
MLGNVDFQFVLAAGVHLVQQFVGQYLEFSKTLADLQFLFPQGFESGSGFGFLLVKDFLLRLIAFLGAFDNFVGFRMTLVSVVAFLGSVSSCNQGGGTED